MTKAPVAEIEFQLKRLFSTYVTQFNQYQWPVEDLRWAELANVVLSRIAGKTPAEMRLTTQKLVGSELLDIESLESLKVEGGGIVDLKQSHARRLADILFESKFSREQVNDCVITLHEIAKGFSQSYEGKVQKYLRSYAEQMIADLDRNFKFSRFKKADSVYAFSLWFQNVLNMPISLREKSIDEFCMKLGVTPDELLKTADKLDINLALVDDLIEDYQKEQKEKEKNRKEQQKDRSK